MKKIGNWIIALATALVMGFPMTSSAAVKMYSAPQGIEASTDFAVTVDGQKAFVFYVAENSLRKTFLPGAEVTASEEDEAPKKAGLKVSVRPGALVDGLPRTK